MNLHETRRKALRLLNKEISDRSGDAGGRGAAGNDRAGDENHLIQIVLNLVQNSLDALGGPRGGRRSC
jgi:two-component system sensor histidine kinase PhcS